MHHVISTTLSTLRQDLAAKLGGDFIHAACRVGAKRGQGRKGVRGEKGSFCETG